MKKITIIFLAGLLSSACTHAPEGGHALMAYLHDPANGLLQERTVNDVLMTVMYRPPAYQEMLDSREQGGDTAAHAYDAFLYFSIKLRKFNYNPDPEAVQHLDFEMGRDFGLVCEKDTLPPVFCQKISNGIPGSNEFIVVFDKPGAMKNGWRDFSLLYRDKLFGMGRQLFAFYREDLLKIPLIKSK